MIYLFIVPRLFKNDTGRVLLKFMRRSEKMARYRIMAIFMIIFIAVLAAATVSATDVNDTAPDADTQVTPQQAQPQKDIETNQKIIEKNVKTQKKQAQETVSTWDGLKNAITSAGENTTIKLEQASYTNFETIRWNHDHVITVDGNGQTIDVLQQTAFHVDGGCSLILKNIKLINAIGVQGATGAIYNNGTLTVSNSTFTNNHAGAICNEADLTVSGSTFTDNIARDGAAIYNNGTLTVTCSTFTGNTAKERGGAIFNNANVTLSGSSFAANNATLGGAICNLEDSLTVSGSSFTGNNATDGAAVYSNATLTVSDSTFTDNLATDGGAIHNLNATLTVSGSSFTGNKAEHMKLLYFNDGGAILNEYGNLTVSNSSFIGNTVEYQGGAILNFNGTLTVSASTFTGNNASTGGAIHNNDGNLTLSASTFTGNNASAGGAVYQSSGYLTVSDSAFTDNYAPGGGALYLYKGNYTVSNSTFTDNKAKSGGAIYKHLNTLTLSDSTFTGNNANWGGAISSIVDNTTISGSTFAANNASRGGAIHNDEGVLTVTGSTFTGNTAKESGGAIYNTDLDFRPCTVNLSGSSFEHNTAALDGAAVYNNNYTDTTIKGCCFIENTAGNKETLDLNDGVNEIRDNTYQSTDIAFNKTQLALKDNKTVYLTGDDAVLKFRVELANPDNYDKNIIEKLNKTIYVNGEKNVTVNNAEYTLSDLKLGNYRAYYNTSGSKSNTVRFNVEEMKTCILTIDSIADIKFNDNLTVYGKLINTQGTGISGEKVTVNVNGADSKVTTDANGVWKLKVKTTTLGTNNVTASYNGTLYYPFTAATTFEIAQTETIITIDKIMTTQFRDNVTITGTFKNSNGKAIANSKVRVNVNGYSTYVTTDYYGAWSLTLKTNRTGVNNVTASFSGNANYAKYTANTTFNVTKQDLVITTEVKYNKGNFTITGTFVDKNGNKLANSKIRVNINGKAVYVKTDSNGTYTYSEMITVKTVKFNVYYGGSANYNSYTSSKTTLTVA